MNDHLALLRGTTAQIVCALFPVNPAAAADPAGTIATVFNALKATSLDAETVAADKQAKREPAVSARKSLASNEHIVSMIDGKPYKTLRRHLSTHGFTPESYRAEFGLPDSYPMVAKAYSEARRGLAIASGLGRKSDPAAPTVG